MKTYRIVVGFDGSDGGSRALSWAVAEAAERGGTVQAVTAWQWTEPEVLTTAAADADLLVLGSHGHGRLFHAVLGSVAEQCIRAAVCPVVVVPVPHEVKPRTAPISTAMY